MAITAPASPRAYRRDRPVLWHHLDVGLIGIVLAISIVGVLMVFSATRGPATADNPADTSFLYRQGVFVVAGLIVMTIVASIDYRRLRALVPVGYLATVLLLVVTPFVARDIQGARAWIEFGGVRIQPSEFGKVVVILSLAAFFAAVDQVDLRRLLAGLMVVGLPVALVYLQNDLGTVLVYLAITGGMVLVTGVAPRNLAIVFFLLVGLIGVGLASDQLQEYQVARLTSFLSEDVDPDDWQALRAKENVEQAQIAIGNGGMFGQGLFQGSQTRSNLVFGQETDFIFSVVAEELGFVGAATLLTLFALLLARIWRIANLSADRLGMFICVGVFAMLLFHIFESVGMNLGLMPVTGIPLPFVSYGGSSLITMFAAIGLVLSVNMRRFS